MRPRILATAALLAAGVLAQPASAGPCVTADGLPANGRVVACALDRCTFAQGSSSDVHQQVPICVFPVAQSTGNCVVLFPQQSSLQGAACYLTGDGQVACAGAVWLADTWCVPGGPR